MLQKKGTFAPKGLIVLIDLPLKLTALQVNTAPLIGLGLLQVYAKKGITVPQAQSQVWLVCALREISALRVLRPGLNVQKVNMVHFKELLVLAIVSPAIKVCTAPLLECPLLKPIYA